MSDLWKNLSLEPELREFMTLSGADVGELTALALCAEDPAAWLSAELNKRARNKKNVRDAHYAQRKKDDAAKIGWPGSWPDTRLRLKTQPWVTDMEGTMRFAFVFHYDHLTVHQEDGKTVVYDTIEEMVETWSVD